VEQETLLGEIKNMPKRTIKPLEENDIKTVSDLLNSDEEKLIEIKGITETSLEKIYDAVQTFVEENQSEKIAEDAIDSEVEGESSPEENIPELEKEKS
jgi:DNA-directed RNA polymerase alpha subunit